MVVYVALKKCYGEAKEGKQCFIGLMLGGVPSSSPSPDISIWLGSSKASSRGGRLSTASRTKLFRNVQREFVKYKVEGERDQNERVRRRRDLTRTVLHKDRFDSEI